MSVGLAIGRVNLFCTNTDLILDSQLVFIPLFIHPSINILVPLSPQEGVAAIPNQGVFFMY